MVTLHNYFCTKRSSVNKFLYFIFDFLILIMSTIRYNLVKAAISKAWASLDYNIHKDFHKQYEFIKQTILADNSLTNDEKTEAVRLNNKDYDRDKIMYNSGTRRICENCNQECLATSYCEYCVQNYLKTKFSYWT